jgi:hypothetical protein
MPQQKSTDEAGEQLAWFILKLQRQGEFTDEDERRAYLRLIDEYLASFAPEAVDKP